MKLTESIRHGFYRLKYRFGKNLNITTPVDVSIELAAECNQFCSYCYYAKGNALPFTKGFMDTTMAKDIIFQASELGVNALKFNYRGESTLHPEYKSITSLAKRLATGSTFIDRVTNSNFKFRTDKDEIFDGLCNQTKVKVSYDSFNKEVFETQRAGGDHAITTRNIDKFYSYPKRRKTELVIQAVRTKLNKDEDIAGLCKQRWANATVSIRDMVSGRVDKDLSSLEHKRRDFANRQSCLQAHVRLIVAHDGKVQVCCPDIAGKLVVGDVTKESLSSIFNGPLAKQVRQSLKSKTAFTKEPCKSCPSHESFTGYKHPWTS